jgi:hypothetical protein
MVEYSFVRTNINHQENGKITFTASDVDEKIWIAADWAAGEELLAAKKPHQHTGFIGRGFTKRGVYVCGLSYCSLESNLIHICPVGSIQQPGICSDSAHGRHDTGIRSEG